MSWEGLSFTSLSSRLTSIIRNETLKAKGVAIECLHSFKSFTRFRNIDSESIAPAICMDRMEIGQSGGCVNFIAFKTTNKLSAKRFRANKRQESIRSYMC